MDDDKLNNPNNLPNNNNPRPEDRNPVVSNAGQNKDVLDPETEKDNGDLTMKNTGSGKKDKLDANQDSRQGEDVLNPEDKKEKYDGDNTGTESPINNGGNANPSSSPSGPSTNVSNTPNMGTTSPGTGTPGVPSGTPPTTGTAPVAQGASQAGTVSTASAAGTTTEAVAGGGGIIAGGWIVIVIMLIIIIIIGLLGFLFNMPGLMMGKLKEIRQGLWDGIQSMFTSEADAFINDDDVVELAQYLKDMQYDLIGYGFIRAQDEDDNPTYLELEEDGYTLNYDGQYYKVEQDGQETLYDGQYYSTNGMLIDNLTLTQIEEDKWFVHDNYIKDKYGIRYWASDGEEDGTSHTKGQISTLKYADTSLLRAYLMADYRITVLRNNDEGFLENLGQELREIFGGSPNAWSKGLIKLYQKTGTTVTDFSNVDKFDSLWWNDAKILDSGTKLSIKNGYFNRPMEFELDGWTGRYGLSLEFLLSLHLGTMAPDLVTAMLQSFNTEIQVYVESIEDAQVLSKYIDYEIDSYEGTIPENNEEVTIETMNEALNEDSDVLDIQDGFFVEWVNGLSLNKKKCYTLLRKTGLTSPPNCIHTAMDYVILHMQSHYGEWFDNSYNYLKVDYGVEDPFLEEFEYNVKEDSDKTYNADNSLFSLRKDYGSRNNSEEIIKGLDSHVYPDRETALNTAKEYGLTDSDIRENTETNFTEGADSSKVTSNNEVIGPDNYVYRIERNIQDAEWSMYGYLDGSEFKTVPEETFNQDTDNIYEETVGYYNSYIYKIYQVGIVENDKVLYYEDGEILYDVLYLNFVVRDKTLEELVQCGILQLDENGNYVRNEDAGLCSTTSEEEMTKCCTICQRYVKRVIKALAQVQDTDYSYYQPYIARVVGSWFRDTYFIIPEQPDGALIDYYGSGNVPINAYGTNGSYVKVDEEYLNASGEYWTDYEMKIDPETNEETNEYQLYYLFPDGSFTRDGEGPIKMEEWLESNGFATQVAAEQEGHVFVKRAKLLSIQDVKENTQKENEDDEIGRDMEKAPYMDESMVWSAYSVGTGDDTGWIKINRGEVDAVDKVLDMVEDRGEFYYRLSSTKSIEQEEDAIRTETNATVKNLFRYRQFYIYNGTAARAEEIQKDREKVNDLIISYWNNSSYNKSDAVDDLSRYGRYALRETFKTHTITIFTDDTAVAEAWLEWQLDMYYRAGNENALSDKEKELFKLDELCEYGIKTEYINDKGESETYLDSKYYKLDNHSLDPRNRHLIATVNITKSSLDAFSILENVNTLDSDYQYRDFKELVVELNYFDKEDLSESIEEVFTWLAPTHTSRWPIIAIDKQNNDYGTLVHSQPSIDFLIKVYEKLVEEEKALNPEQDGETIEDDAQPQDIETNFDMSKVYYIGDSWFEALKTGNVTESSNDYFTTKVGAAANDSIYNNIQVKSDATAIVVMLGLNNTSSQSSMKLLLDDLSSRYSNKTIYVLKVFHVGRNYTNMDKDQMNENIDKYNNDISAYCSTKGNVKFVDVTDGLIDSDGYLDPSYESDDGMHLISYSKLYSNIKDIVEKGKTGAGVQSENEQILNQLREATSYAENDAIISPVTGKIIAYGEHSRINVYTNEVEKVGYVKIEIMGYGEDKSDINKSYFTKEMLASTNVEEDKKEDIVKGLNSFYDEYKNQCAGYILMIDGIDITDLKNGFTNIVDSDGNAVEYDSLCEYEKEVVTALYNSKEQKRREAEADAKVEAPYFMSYNANYIETNGEYTTQDALGGYYIKEGAYLGKAQSPTDRTGEKIEHNAGMQEENSNISYDNPADDGEVQRTVDIQKAYDEFLEDKNPDYLRMILLDTELTVIDNVEDYFPGFEEESGSIDELDNEKFLYWMGMYVEAGELEESGGKWYSLPKDLKDGAGKTHYFGITSRWNDDLAKEMGYNLNWDGKIELEALVNMYLALVEEDKAYVKSELGEDIPDGYLQAFISIKHNYGNLTKRGTEYKRTGRVSEATWTTYEGSQYAEALTRRRKAEWELIQTGKYLKFYEGDSGELDFTDGGKYSEETPFTDWCVAHGVTNIQVAMPED